MKLHLNGQQAIKLLPAGRPVLLGATFSVTRNKMRCSYAVAVCVLGALLATAWAADWQEGQLFAEWARMSSDSIKAPKTKILSDYERADAKHICLKEGKQHNCQYAGCPFAKECGTACEDSACDTHVMGQ